MTSSGETMTSSAVPMTDDGRGVIERTLEANIRPVHDVSKYFEIERCSRWILENGYKKVALQFPDELLSYSVQVADSLREKCEGAVISVMADTSYASCCVDDITAEHCGADSIVHIGHACLSPAYRYPVLYVYGRDSLDVDDFCDKYRAAIGPDEKVLVFYGVEYAYICDELQKRLADTGAVFTSLPDPNTPSSDRHISCGRQIPLSKEEVNEFSALYIGTRQTTLSNLVLSLNQCKFYSYNPDEKIFQQEHSSVNRTIMKRFNMIEKTKDARIVGIIAGAAGHRDYQDIVKRIKELLRKAGKKYYTFLVGKLNVPKLANFSEIDVFVLVACHENTMLDCKEFYQPVVTPLEVEWACNPDREWSTEYTTDFSQLLPNGQFHVPLSEKIEMSAEVSLVTGQIRTLGTDDVTEMAVKDGQMVSRNQNMTVANVRTAGDHLGSRTFRGLEQNLGQTPVTAAVQGQIGIARAYRDVQRDENT